MNQITLNHDADDILLATVKSWNLKLLLKATAVNGSTDQKMSTTINMFCWKGYKTDKWYDIPLENYQQTGEATIIKFQAMTNEAGEFFIRAKRVIGKGNLHITIDLTTPAAGVMYAENPPLEWGLLNSSDVTFTKVTGYAKAVIGELKENKSEAAELKEILAANG